MEMTVRVQRRLRWYSKHERSTDLTVNIETIVFSSSNEMIGKPSAEDEYISEVALQAEAERNGRSTWDERDICTLLKCERDPEAVWPTPAEEG